VEYRFLKKNTIISGYSIRIISKIIKFKRIISLNQEEFIYSLYNFSEVGSHHTLHQLVP